MYNKQGVLDWIDIVKQLKIAYENFGISFELGTHSINAVITQQHIHTHSEIVYTHIAIYIFARSTVIKLAVNCA